MSYAVLFPGQGSQYVGMSKVFVDAFSWTKAIFEEASDNLSINLSKLILEGPESEITLTINAQPAILATSYAWYQVLSKMLGISPSAAAGHSLGEYSALTAAKSLKFSDAIQLVRERGRLMQEAVPEGHGKMAALIGISDTDAEKLCEIATKTNSLVVPANFNAPGQVVVAGHSAAVDRLIALGSSGEAGIKVRKAMPLNVSAPFHCPLMKPVAEKFYEFLKKVTFSDAQFPIACNVDGKLYQKTIWTELLKDQIVNNVRWTSCINNLHEAGVDTFIEVGPGKVLTGLVQRILEKPLVYSVDCLESFKHLEKEWPTVTKG